MMFLLQKINKLASLTFMQFDWCLPFALMQSDVQWIISWSVLYIIIHICLSLATLLWSINQCYANDTSTKEDNLKAHLLVPVFHAWVPCLLRKALMSYSHSSLRLGSMHMYTCVMGSPLSRGWEPACWLLHLTPLNRWINEEQTGGDITAFK